jgi:hypothetical protein
MRVTVGEGIAGRGGRETGLFEGVEDVSVTIIGGRECARTGIRKTPVDVVNRRRCTDGNLQPLTVLGIRDRRWRFFF